MYGLEISVSWGFLVCGRGFGPRLCHVPAFGPGARSSVRSTKPYVSAASANAPGRGPRAPTRTRSQRAHRSALAAASGSAAPTASAPARRPALAPGACGMDQGLPDQRGGTPGRPW
jgi:hypothetical protein